MEACESFQLTEVSQNAAQKVFSALATDCPKLTVLDINALDASIGCIEDRTFLRAKQTDIYGNVKHVGAPVQRAMAKYDEPASDILEPEKFLLI